MANLTGKYDPNAEARQDLGKLPTGEYIAQIVDSDIKPTKSNNGEYAEFVYEIMDGPLKGRKHWQRVTLENPNAEAVRIGNQHLAALRDATGVNAPRDTQEFHFKPHIIRIEFQPEGSVIAYGSKKGQMRDRDEAEIKDWRKLDDGIPGFDNAPSSGQQQAGSAGAAPWNRNRAA